MDHWNRKEYLDTLSYMAFHIWSMKPKENTHKGRYLTGLIKS